MRSLIRLLSAPAMTLMLTCGSATAGSALSAGEVRALFPGKFEAVWKEKRRLTLNASAGGGLVGSLGIASGSGRWWIKGSHLCISFDRWKDERVRCSRVVRSGDWYLGLFRDSGTPRLRFRPI